MKPYRKLSVGSLAVLTILTFCVFELIADRDVWADSRREAALNPLPSAIPDRIVLTWRDNPVTSQAVTWRTDSTVKQAFAEIAPADPSPTQLDDGLSSSSREHPKENSKAPRSIASVICGHQIYKEKIRYNVFS